MHFSLTGAQIVIFGYSDEPGFRCARHEGSDTLMHGLLEYIQHPA